MPMYGTENWRGWSRPKDLDDRLDEPANWWTNEQRSGDLRALVRLQPAPNGRVELTGVFFERRDRAPLAVRDIANAHIGELTQAARHTRGWMVGETDNDMLGRLTTERPVKRAGRVSSREHYQRVWEMWLQAQSTAPERPVAWLRERWLDERGEQIPWPTMTRWVAVAKERFGDERTTK